MSGHRPVARSHRVRFIVLLGSDVENVVKARTRATRRARVMSTERLIGAPASGLWRARRDGDPGNYGTRGNVLSVSCGF